MPAALEIACQEVALVTHVSTVLAANPRAHEREANVMLAVSVHGSSDQR